MALAASANSNGLLVLIIFLLVLAAWGDRINGHGTSRKKASDSPGQGSIKSITETRETKTSHCERKTTSMTTTFRFQRVAATTRPTSE